MFSWRWPAPRHCIRLSGSRVPLRGRSQAKPELYPKVNGNGAPRSPVRTRLSAPFPYSWESSGNKSPRLDILASQAHLGWVISANNDHPFPVDLPWEEFTQYRVTIEELRERAPQYDSALAISFIANRATPILPVNAIERLIAQSNSDLEKTAASNLNVDLRAIGLWFLMPAARAVADADLDATRRYLGELTRLSQDILPSLSHVLALLPASISAHLGQISEWNEGEDAFDHQMVARFIKALPELSKRLTADVEAKSKGRRPNFVLDHSVTLAAAAFERAGLSLVPRGPSATQPSARLTGCGSRLFVAYFLQLDKHLSEATLSQAMIRCRRRTQAGRI